MRGLAIYTVVVIGLVQLYLLGEMIDGYEEAYISLLIMAFYAPPIVFGVLYLKGKKK